MIEHDSLYPMWYSETSSGLIADANEAALRFWGYERDAFIGMPAIRLLAPEELARQRKLSKLAIKGRTGPWKCLRADGTTVYVIVQWTRMKSDGETVDLVTLHSSGEDMASLQRHLEEKKDAAPLRSPPSAAKARARR